jgi:hypothetical protein
LLQLQDGMIFEKDGGQGSPAIRKKQHVRGWTLQPPS